MYLKLSAHSFRAIFIRFDDDKGLMKQSVHSAQAAVVMIFTTGFQSNYEHIKCVLYTQFSLVRLIPLKQPLESIKRNDSYI